MTKQTLHSLSYTCHKKREIQVGGANAYIYIDIKKYMATEMTQLWVLLEKTCPCFPSFFKGTQTQNCDELARLRVEPLSLLITKFMTIFLF